MSRSFSLCLLKRMLMFIQHVMDKSCVVGGRKRRRGDDSRLMDRARFCSLATSCERFKILEGEKKPNRKMEEISFGQDKEEVW